MRSQTLVLMALATLSLGLSIPKDRRENELDSILAALQQNNPEDAAAAGSASAGNPRKRQQDELAAAIAALQQNNPQDAAAAAAAGQSEAEKRATNEDLEAILDACKCKQLLVCQLIIEVQRSDV